ncbi:MAG: chromophore lyase CpcT/CpeT [Bacteroidota bacterium]
MKSIFVLLAATCLIFACNNPSAATAETQEQTELDQLYQMMRGTFSSEAQSIRDTSFFNINLVMHPIWEGDADTKWLYVEQAVTEYIDEPYRQRVYRLSRTNEGLFESKVYELPGPERFVHAWNQPDIFSRITADSLIVREGCAVYLQKEANNCYRGETKDKACLSSLRGATYATSIVAVCEDGVVSWDQGWNAEDEQVWGAEKEGYVFDRKE